MSYCVHALILTLSCSFVLEGDKVDEESDAMKGVRWVCQIPTSEIL